MSFIGRLGSITTYVTTGEVTSLEHELGNDTMELRVLVSKPSLPGAKGTEVLDGLGDYIVVEIKVDPTGLI
jgi:hypothetical protein